MRKPEVIGADIVEAQAVDGSVPTDLYMEGSEAGLNVDNLIDQAVELYELSEETFNEACD